MVTWLFQGHPVRIQLRDKGTSVSFHLLFLTSRSEPSPLCNFSLVYLGAGWAKAESGDPQMKLSWTHHTPKMKSRHLMALRGNSSMPKETLNREPIQGRRYVHGSLGILITGVCTLFLYPKGPVAQAPESLHRQLPRNHFSDTRLSA